MDEAQRAFTTRPPVTKAATMPPPKRGFVLALFAIALALPAWLEGARTTRDGWIIAINWVLARASVPLQIAPAALWHWGVALLALLALGYGYSRVEIVHAPIRPPKEWRKNFFAWHLWYFERSWQRWLVWFVLIVTDVGTMYLGARHPTPGDAAIFHQIAASSTIAASYAILITFIPDQLLRYGWRGLRS